MSRNRPGHKNDFEAIYNLLDPAPYFDGLQPADYRMPWVLATWLRKTAALLCKLRRTQTLMLADFACGYGTNGAFLRHQLSVQELYAYYGQRNWQQADAKRYWTQDRAYFFQRSQSPTEIQIAGLDVATNALDYAQYMGFIDQQFSDDIINGLPGDALAEFLASVDIVVESGAISTRLTEVCQHIVSCARPWFLHCPRPDVNWRPLREFWVEVGYETFALNDQPIRYRKALSEMEYKEIDRASRALGVDEAYLFRDGYMCTDLMLALPKASLSDDDLLTLRTACIGLA